MICCELLLTKLTQRLPLAWVVTVGFTLLGLGQLVYALPWGVWVFIAGTLIWTIAEITAGPTMASYPGMAAPSRLRGRYIASMQTMFNLGCRGRSGARRGDLPSGRQRGVVVVCRRLRGRTRAGAGRHASPSTHVTQEELAT